MYYVYELVNLLGTVEYVGQTVRPKVRFNFHTRVKAKPGNWHGRFYGRQDISMHIVATYATKAEALQAEFDLQVFWGLPTDRSTRAVKGSKNGNSKLTEEQVREIRTLLSQNLSCVKIARKFNVGKTTIGFIKQGKFWTHVK